MNRDRPEHEPVAVDPDDSPWPVPPVEGIPFEKDSAEAKAIARILDRREQEAAGPAPSPET